MSALSRAFPVVVWLIGAPLAAGLTCGPADDIVWVRFNGIDTLDVPVSPSGDGAPLALELRSSGGVSVVGEAVVDPGAAPANTTHLITVRVDDAYRMVVQRVELVVTSDGRGEDAFELSQDSADRGFWWIELRSFGAADAQRVDTFEFALYRPESIVVTPDTSDTADTASADEQPASDRSWGLP